jgi:DNA-binding GntR family transcriptional regulator
MCQIDSEFEKAPRPLKSENQINQMRNYLNDRPRDLLLFELAIQTGIPMKKLLSLKARDLAGSGVGDRISIGIGRGGASHFFILTHSLYRVWETYLRQITPSKDDYIFKSRKGVNPLSLSTVSNMVNNWFMSLDLANMSGIRSLKKTWEVHYRDNAESVPFPRGTSASIDVLEPVKIATAQEIVYDRLMDAILSGRILPGQWLSIKDIALQMNVSRVPVREAFLRLQAGGFISPVKRSSAVVIELSRDNLEETLEIRLNIESMAAKKAAARCTDQTLQQLESLHSEFEKVIRTQDAEKTLKVNKQFHFAIYREAQMPILLEIIESLWNRIIPYFNILLRLISEKGHVLSQESRGFHKAILNAMRHRDPEEVAKWLHVDLTEAYRVVYDFFDELKKG